MHPGIDRQDIEMLRSKADVDIGRALKAAQKETGQAEQHERHGNLAGYEHVTQAESAARTGQRILSLEGVGKEWTRGGPGRSHSQEKSAEDAHRETVEQH